MYGHCVINLHFRAVVNCSDDVPHLTIQPRFMPTNFARLKREASSANGASSSGDGTASGSVDSVFADLVKAAATEGQARGGPGGGRGRGRGGRVVSQVTAFSGGGEGQLYCVRMSAC